MSPKVHLVGKTNVTPSNIIFLKAEANYSEVFMLDGQRIILSKTLKQMETLFAPFGFYRPHKSFLINLEHVVSCSVHTDRLIELTNNFKAELSRRKKNDFMEIRSNKKVSHC
ncbi:LytR/AlgR family response regulator transcription factor [Lacihabitans soyangensis]|jgi:DNA-binding LytR/AlgR family response regulator|uniref:LytTR family transcriptional regulator n=1 Tax=Lacihabitans soyangensis TaxID=869394 RepID=A0AAE3H2H0_9BACT|nr:LytTR family DNA-binding domain-containing protein [Lacihabitans soyangensis]MCP9762751.1 LytTR family transcriptional regulator [Lacihabitans soyangensis]